MSYATTHNDDTTHLKPIMTDARSPMKCMPAIWTPTITREEDAAASKPSLFPKYGNRVARTRSAESYSKLPSAVKMTPTRSETGPTTSEFEVSGRQSARRTSFGHPSPPKLDGWRPASRASAEKDAYGTEDRQAPTSQDTEEERLWGVEEEARIERNRQREEEEWGGTGQSWNRFEQNRERQERQARGARKRRGREARFPHEQDGARARAERKRPDSFDPEAPWSPAIDSSNTGSSKTPRRSSFANVSFDRNSASSTAT
ncbi:hypothetical protein BDQ17DRAFT_1361484 [Cyathus striatus]|nr:hypothetical protein BDQ17DRAFT_1361484 [Cyathus striatus]